MENDVAYSRPFLLIQIHIRNVFVVKLGVLVDVLGVEQHGRKQRLGEHRGKLAALGEPKIVDQWDDALDTYGSRRPVAALGAGHEAL